VNENRRIEKLSRHHAVESFDCGREELNQFLIRYAWANQQANASQTYVGLVDDAVTGFYTLTVGAAASLDGDTWEIRDAHVLDAPGQPFWDPEADAALFRALDQTVRQTSNRQLIRLKRNINEPEFAGAIVTAFRSLIGRPGKRRRVAR